MHFSLGIGIVLLYLFLRVIVAVLNVIEMANTCDICTDQLSGTSVMKCYGICGRSFHIPCLASSGEGNAQYKNALSTYLSKIPNLHWYCENCHPLSLNRIVTSFVDQQKLLHSVVPPMTNISNRNETDKTGNSDLHSENDGLTFPLQTATIDLNQQQIPLTDNLPLAESMDLEAEINDVQTEHESQHTNTSDFSPSTFASEFWSRVHASVLPSHIVGNTNINTRKRGRSPTINNDSAKRAAPGTSGTFSLSKFVVNRENGENTIRDSARPSPLIKKVSRSLYLTPFDPKTMPNDIITHLNTFEHLQHITNEFTCTKLVKRNRFKSKLPLTFVSFRLDVPRQHYDTVAAQHMWPDNVSAKQFFDKATPNNQHMSNEIVEKPKNSNGMGKQHQKRQAHTPKRHTISNQSQRVNTNRRQTHSTRCMESCCNHQQVQRHHYHQNRYTDHYAGNQSDNRFNPFRRY